MAGVAFEAGQFREGDLLQRLANGVVDALPAAADAAAGLQVALAVVRGALGQRQGAFECIENAGRGDLAGGPGEAVAAAQAARGFQQARTIAAA